MSERIQKEKVRTSGREAVDQTVEVVEVSPEAQAKADELKANLDDLLDEIDEVLETNAEDFVKSYVQKGGE